MPIIRRYVWILLLLAAVAPATGQARTILVVGDSLSAAYGIDPAAGWVARLQQRLDQQRPGSRVVNASISGDTTANGLARLPRALAQHRPDIVILELGGNDGLRGLPLAAMKQNLAGMIQRAQAARARVLLVGIRLPPNYGQTYTQRFNRVYTELATEHRVPLVPFLLDRVAGQEGLMQADAIHPTAAAQRQILENVWPTLKTLL